jgi:hypothetical protein
MISEVVPHGKEVSVCGQASRVCSCQFLFFALFSIIGKTSSFIGPFVSSAIIDRSGNANMPFTFLLGLGAFAVAILWMVDVDKSRIECRRYLEDEAVRVYEINKSSAGSTTEGLVVGDPADMDGQQKVVYATGGNEKAAN